MFGVNLSTQQNSNVGVKGGGRERWGGGVGRGGERGRPLQCSPANSSIFLNLPPTNSQSTVMSSVCGLLFVVFHLGCQCGQYRVSGAENSLHLVNLITSSTPLNSLINGNETKYALFSLVFLHLSSSITAYT